MHFCDFLKKDFSNFPNIQRPPYIPQVLPPELLSHSYPLLVYHFPQVCTWKLTCKILFKIFPATLLPTRNGRRKPLANRASSRSKRSYLNGEKSMVVHLLMNTLKVWMLRKVIFNQTCPICMSNSACSSRTGEDLKLHEEKEMAARNAALREALSRARRFQLARWDFLSVYCIHYLVSWAIYSQQYKPYE